MVIESVTAYPTRSNGLWKTWQLLDELREILAKTLWLSFSHVRRQLNSAVNSLANGRILRDVLIFSVW